MLFRSVVVVVVVMMMVRMVAFVVCFVCVCCLEVCVQTKLLISCCITGNRVNRGINAVSVAFSNRSEMRPGKDADTQIPMVSS